MYLKNLKEIKKSHNMFDYIINYTYTETLDFFEKMSKTLSIPIFNKRSIKENSIIFFDEKTINLIKKIPKNLNSLFFIIIEKDKLKDILKNYENYIHGYIFKGESIIQEHMINMISCSLLNKSFSDYYPFAEKTSVSLSLDRFRLINILEESLNKANINKRIQSIITNTFDELLMNAIYDAPIDASKTHILKTISRDSILILDKPIEIELVFHKNFLAFSIKDFYGSFSYQVLNNFLSKNLASDETYIPIDDNISKGGGLGLSIALNTGIPLLFNSKENEYTRVIGYFGFVDSFKSFKNQEKIFLNNLFHDNEILKKIA